jgi:hypothetical protein
MHAQRERSRQCPPARLSMRAPGSIARTRLQGLGRARGARLLRLRLRLHVMRARARRQVSKAADLANQTAAEAVAAIRTVAAFGMEAALAAQFAAELRAPWRQFCRTALVTGLAFGASMAVLFMARALRAPASRPSAPAPAGGCLHTAAAGSSTV